MWDFGNVRTDGRSSQMATYHTVMHEIHVLLVDHDSEGLVNTAKLLELCQYRVTYVELASAAITMLSSGKIKFDIVLANINSPDLHGFKLLQFGVNQDIPVVLMSVDDNAYMVSKALDNGAFLYIKKPMTIELMRCLWQYVLKEKRRMIREKDSWFATNYSSVPRGIEFRDHVSTHHEEETPNSVEEMTMTKNKCTLKKKNRGKKIGDEDVEEYDSETRNHNVKRKMCTEWTRELHTKFMQAVDQLGEGRCFPKEILELMNEPGLTRMQVASHLQKCRNDNWRSPEERKAPQVIIIQPTPVETQGPQHKPRRFGSKPQLGKISLSYHSQDSQGTDQGSETQSETDQIVNKGERGNVGKTPPTVTTNANRQHHYGPFAPGLTNARPGPSNTRRDDYFNFQYMDCLINRVPSHVAQGSGSNNPNQVTPAAYRVCPEQNSAGESRSQWSSETSNFGSDDSTTRGNSSSKFIKKK